MLGVRLDTDLENRLAALAERTQRSKSYHAKEALKRYIEEEEAKELAEGESLARWESYQENGKHVSNEEVMSWLDTWGTEQEKPCPKT